MSAIFLNAQCRVESALNTTRENMRHETGCLPCELQRTANIVADDALSEMEELRNIELNRAIFDYAQMCGMDAHDDDAYTCGF